MEFSTGMSKDDRAAVSGALTKLLADTYVLYVKTQNFHWNLTGPEFFSLHQLAQEHYEEMAEAIDEIAERIRALGFFIEGSMETFLKNSSIEEDHKICPKHEFLKNLLSAHEMVITDARSLFVVAEKHKDPSTADLMARRLNFHEKAAWMLRSQL